MPVMTQRSSALDLATQAGISPTFATAYWYPIAAISSSDRTWSSANCDTGGTKQYAVDRRSCARAPASGVPSDRESTAVRLGNFNRGTNGFIIVHSMRPIDGEVVS